VTAPGTGGFLFGHQQGIASDRNQPSFAVLPANVTQVVGSEVAGAGLSIDYTQGTHAAVTGLGATTFDGAVNANDYISMSFTTTATQPESWITHVTKLNAGGPGYSFAISISTDGFQTATLLSKDNPSPQNAASTNYAANYPNFDGTDFKLTPGTTYEIRAYIYNVAGGVAATAKWDDFYVFFAADPAGNETTFTEGGTAVAIAAAGAEIEDVNNANMVSGLVTLTNKQTDDRLLIAGVSVSNGSTGTIGGIGYTVTDTGSAISIALSGSATKAQYTAAIAAITFENTSNTPDTMDRIVNVTVHDGVEASNIATTIIHVIPAPDAVNDPVTILEDAPATSVNPLANDDTGAGIDNVADVTIPAAPLATQGMLTYTNGAGTVVTVTDGTALSATEAATLQFRPALNFNGTVTIPYVLTDLNGATSNAVVVVTVTAVNDPVQVVDPNSPATDPSNPAYGPADPNAPGYDPENPTGIPDKNNLIPDVVSTDGASPAPIPAGTYFGDAEGDILVFSATGLPPGLLIDPATGLISGTLEPGASQAATPGYPPGSYLVVITATDPDGNIASTTVTYTITNLPPVAVNDAASVLEDGPAIAGNVITDAVTGDLDTAPDSDALTVAAINGDPSLVGQPVSGSTGGTFTVTADGSWTFDPGHAFDNLALGVTRDTIITYRVSDGQGGTAEATITVTVTGENDAPVALGPIAPQTATDSAPVTAIDTSAAFDNPSNLPLVYTAANLPAGLIIDPITGLITGTPSRDASVQGPYIVTVTATGPNGETATAALPINVLNPAPGAVNDNAATAADTPVTIAPLVNDSDPDGDALTLIAITPPANGTATINPDGTISYIPNAGFTGTEILSYTVTDNQGGTTTATITITVGAPPADAPIVTGSILPQTGTDDAPITPINAGSLFSDPNGGLLTFTAAGLPPGLVMDPVTGVITGTPEPDASVDGPYTVAVTAVDPDGNQVTTTVILAVINPAPVATDDATATPLDTPVVMGVLGNDADPDGDMLHVSYASDPAHGTVAVNPDGTITYTPDTGYTGPDTFTYTVSDGEGGTSIATVSVLVGAPLAGQPEVSGSIAPATGIDGAPITPVNVGSQITDPNGDPLVFSAAGLPPGLAIDPVTGIITGTLTPNASVDGPFMVTITAVDPNGNQITTMLVITALNPAPAAGNDLASTRVDQPVVIGVLANDSDPDGDTITVTSATDPSHGTVIINPNGTITFTPDAGFTGIDTFTYTLTDANGASVTATVTVNIGVPGPLAATPAIAPALGTDGAPITPVIVGTAFGDPDQTGPLILSIDPSALPPGLVFDPMTGTVSGTPANNASQGSTPGEPTGTYIVPVTATDSHGATTTTYVTFSFVNLPPAAVDDAAGVGEDTASVVGNVITGPTTGDADTAPDSDPLTVTFADQAGNPITIGAPFTVAGGGTLTLNADGSYTFNPGTAYNGLDTGDTATETITYTVSDGQGGTDTAMLVITINGANDAPVIVDPANPGTPSNPIPTPDPSNIIPDVITFDSVSPPPVNAGQYLRDPEGKPLTFAATGLPPGLSINPATGLITGTLPRDASQGGPNSNGVYTVTITARDAGGLETSTTLIYTVGNPPPVAVNDGPVVTDENRGVTIPVLGNDHDADGDPLTVIAASAGNGSVVINPNGTISYQPRPGFAGTEIITYVISDGNGGTATAHVTVTVRAAVIPMIAPSLPELPARPANPSPSLHVGGAILNSTNGLDISIGSPTFVTGDFLHVAGQSLQNHAVMSAVGQFQPLNGIPSLMQLLSLSGLPPFDQGQGIVEVEIDHLTEMWRTQNSLLQAADGNPSDWGPEGLKGFSLKFGLAQGQNGAGMRERIAIESLLRDRVLMVNVTPFGDFDGVRVAQLRCTQLNGAALPVWLDEAGNGFLIGERPVDVERIDLTIEAVLEDGTTIRKDVRIDLRTGAINSIAAERRAELPAIFTRQLRTGQPTGVTDLEAAGRLLKAS
jgi:large repetitive protein